VTVRAQRAQRGQSSKSREVKESYYYLLLSSRERVRLLSTNLLLMCPSAIQWYVCVVTYWGGGGLGLVSWPAALVGLVGAVRL
jgi:hypothetical protein